MADNSLFMLTDNDIEELRELVRPYLTDKRYSHTLSVAEEVKRLGEIYLPNRVKELIVAALLHDITKKLKTDEQLKLCEEYGIKVDYTTDNYDLINCFGEVHYG